MSKNIQARRKKRQPTIAETADKHIYYEKAVQCVEAEIDFIDQTFRSRKGRTATRLREDFCGTANASCEWIRRRRSNTAYGVDIDPTVLDWGRHHHIAKLKQHQEARIHLINADVFKAKTPKVDIVVAMNFSYWYLKTRNDLRRYFKKAHSCLVADGILFLDAFGGYEAGREMQERTPYKGFTYIWDQAKYNPITGDALMHIHFKFKDGSVMKKAFTYDWRLWTLPELTELLTEAGFKPTVYWEGEDADGNGNGIYSPTTQGTADAGWVAFIVAEKH
ncbi:MAG: Methyltransferase [Gammaproteobacteria bacterium]|nr:Methyltransferase [Gammaproteobacteria bacterium]